jgi:cell division septum initiation protein DivIVA
MDVHDQLNRLAATVRDAKTMPMSGSCLVNRAEMLEALERLRDELPASLDHAEALLCARDAVLAAGREEAERLLERAREEREQLIDEADVLAAATARANTVTMEARAEATRLLADADAYVDRKLADFEMLLGQLGSQVNNGRLRLTFRREADRARVQGTAHGAGLKASSHPDGHVEPEPRTERAVFVEQVAEAADVSVGSR